jgi:UDP-glucose 4-epimerase
LIWTRRAAAASGTHPTSQKLEIAVAAQRILVLGHTGFIGSRLIRKLADMYPASRVEGQSLTGLDLTNEASTLALRETIGPDTIVVMCAAIKKQLGDTPDIFQKNTAIITNFANLVATCRPGRVVYFSSAAVYGEDIENLAITEDTALQPRTYYGLSKITAEWILSKTCEQAGSALCLLRPATIYGPGDLETAYGPSGFLDAAVKQRPLTLWGDGGELRELLYIDDVIEATAVLVGSDVTGPVNIVSGVSYTFADALDCVRRTVGHLPDITSRARSKPKVDNRFDAARLNAAVPGLRFTTLDEGVRLTHQARYARPA